MDNKLYKLMDWPAIEEIVYSESSQPCSILGGHLVKEGYLIQVFRPDAVSVSASVSERKRAIQLEKVDDAGFFAALIPIKKNVKYVLNIEDKNGHITRLRDPYSFGRFDKSEVIFNKFAAGTEYNAYNLLGNKVCEKDGISGVLFRTWAPNALRVSVVGEFNSWDGRIYQMERITDNGIYEIFIPQLEAGQEYMYEIKFKGTNTVLKLDPYARQITQYADAHSVTGEPQAVQDNVKWVKQRKQIKGVNKPLSILEIAYDNIPVNKAKVNYMDIARYITEYVKDTGYTYVLIKGSDSIFEKTGYCYGASGYYAPSSQYGTATDFKHMIKELHNNGIGVIIDFNVAYFGIDIRSIVNYDGGDCYGYLKPRIIEKPQMNITTFAYEKGEVRSFLISAIAMWLDEYNIDGIKITDTATMLYLDYGKNPGEWTPNMYGGNENLDAIEFIKQMNEYVHKRNDGVITIADEKSLWSDVTRNNDNEDSLGFDYKLNDGFNEEFFEFVKQDPLFRKGMYNRVTYEMLYHYKEHFITNLTYEALKDDTLYAMVSGNDDKQRLSDIRAVLGYIYTYPGPVCVSYGNDTGALVSVDDDKMQILSRLEEPAYKQMKAYIKALNTLYTTDNSMYEADSSSDGFEWVDNYNAELTVYSYARYSSDNDMDIVAVNFTPVERKAYELNVPKDGKYKLVFNSDNEEYGGDGKVEAVVVKSAVEADSNDRYKMFVDIPASAMVVYKYEPYTDIEIKEIQIKNEAKAAKVEAEKRVDLARELADKAEEEAVRAANAEKEAKESLRLAQNARKEAEKKALEAVKESERIDEEMKLRLSQLKK